MPGISPAAGRRFRPWAFSQAANFVAGQTVAFTPSPRGTGWMLRAEDGAVLTFVPTIEAARRQCAPAAEWRAESLARHTQAVLQGSFVLAKALGDHAVVLDAIAHLRRYVEYLLPEAKRRRC